MEFKHTPGPWKYRLSTGPGHVYYIETVNQTNNHTFIGEAGGGLQTAREIEANAKIMTCAPEMIQLLKEILKTIDDSDDWWMSDPDRGGFDFEKISEVIKKATS